MESSRNDKFDISEIKPSILLVTVFTGVDLEVDDVRDMRDRMDELSSTPKYAVLLDATNHFVITGEGRALIADKEFGKNRLAAAFVVTSMANRIVGNFFINFNKPHSPTKLFNIEEEALKWLEEQLNKANL